MVYDPVYSIKQYDTQILGLTKDKRMSGQLW
jgi:hypothetical protein